VSEEERLPRPPWSEFKAALGLAGFRPSRRLGQNFLLDENMARAIARDSGIGADEFVLEVGPGCGFLSVHLADRGARLLAVEVDPRLAPIATAFLAPYPAAEVVLADVLAGKHQLAPAIEARLPEEGPWHLVSNLPYSIGGPVLALLAGLSNPPASMTVLLQLEVGERLAATPGTKAWGPLSVAVQWAFVVEIVRTVPANLFWPRPDVESAVVRMERLSDLAPAAERSRRQQIVARLFQRRRQTLGRVVADLLGDRGRAEALFAEWGLAARRRAETLALPELAALARIIQRD
jgi:16S rRNA (adenine1518-N6/adenine1519-N6)-dimethyltransferase